MTENAELINQARQARQHARAPYSGYTVGAAVLGTSGRIYPGCNVESSAFSTTLCAERVAIFGAIAAGEDGFTALAVATKNGGTPCGACRQVIHEQCGEIPIYLVGENSGQPVKFTTSQLLPHPFGPDEI
ncbi:MAG: cytidine deaminase [Candidatus Marinimicrobia bacterium]|nr:cytidine deaminase [Candidatus Neomarinimicrobiota bacterium]